MYCTCTVCIMLAYCKRVTQSTSASYVNWSSYLSFNNSVVCFSCTCITVSTFSLVRVFSISINTFSDNINCNWKELLGKLLIISKLKVNFITKTTLLILISCNKSFLNSHCSMGCSHRLWDYLSTRSLELAKTSLLDLRPFCLSSPPH